VAVVVLAVGIGSTTAVFSVVDKILFRTLPYRQDDHLVSVGAVAPIAPQEFLFPGTYFKWREHQTPFDMITTWSGIVDCNLNGQNLIRMSCPKWYE
jgi:putative ABC transport system permease protein